MKRQLAMLSQVGAAAPMASDQVHLGGDPG
jgi:hypothetical protein